MNKLKASKEKINDLMAKADEIISSARMEVRDLTDVELTSLAEYRSEIEEANKSIEGIKEERAVEGKLENGEKNNEVKDLDNKEKQAQLENRSVELYLRGKQNTELFMENEKELRDITGGMTAGEKGQDTAGNGGITIPDGVYSQIIRKLEQQAPLLGLVEQIPSVTGTLAIARESKASDNMAFVGEGIDAKQLEGQ
ncbi:phage major capsid protein, partial [Jeotgalibaca porci]